MHQNDSVARFRVCIAMKRNKNTSTIVCDILCEDREITTKLLKKYSGNKTIEMITNTQKACFISARTETE